MYKNILIIILCLACVALLAETKTFTANVDHNITRGEAANYVRSFQENNSEAIAAYYFSREAFETILEQEGMVGIRIFNGMSEEGRVNLVMVGVDANGSNFVDGAIMERGPASTIIEAGNPFEMMTVK